MNAQLAAKNSEIIKDVMIPKVYEFPSTMGNALAQITALPPVQHSSDCRVDARKLFSLELPLRPCPTLSLDTTRTMPRLKVSVDFLIPPLAASGISYFIRSLFSASRARAIPMGSDACGP